MFHRRFLKNLDIVLAAVILCILVYGVLIVGTAGTSVTEIKSFLAQKDIQQNVFEYLWQADLWERFLLIDFSLALKQGVWVLIGLLLMAAVMYIPYHELIKYNTKIYILNLLILALVLILGREVMGAQRWIQLGPVTFQPSEFAKVMLIVTFAVYLSTKEGQLNRLRDLAPCFAYVGVPMLLVLMQPDLGTSLVFIAIMFGMLYAAGVRPVLLGGILGSGLAVVVGWVWAHLKLGMWIPLHEYQLKRLIIFLDPWEDLQDAGYHIIQSQIAIGSSGLAGKGFLRGSQSIGQFLPIPESDFIFSVLSEQLGFLGALLLLSLYFVMLYRVLKVAAEAKDTFGMLLAVGVASMFSFHVLVNVGMTMGIMPVTGLPLPLFSYGGSNTIANLIALGIVLNVCVHKKKIMF